MHVAKVQRGTADRRKNRRFPMAGSIDLAAAGIDILIQATLEDISATGCRVSTRVPLRLKHPVRIDLPRPGQSAVRVTGNVVRARGTTSDRTYHYGILFRLDSDELRSDVRDYVSLYASKLARVRHATLHRRAAASGIDVKLQVDISVSDVGRFTATALALRPDRMRIASDRVLRQEWLMRIDVRLPGGTAGAATIVTLRAKAEPGVRNVRGQYVQDVVFSETPLSVRSEIERFIFEYGAKGDGR